MGVEVTCTPLNDCHDIGVCDPGTGKCSDPLKDDNSSCEDGDFCTVGDNCQNGQCKSGDPRDCGPLQMCDSGQMMCVPVI
jgi:hypothetical protein